MVIGADGTDVSRRDFLGSALAGGAALTFGGLLAGGASAQADARRASGARYVVLIDWDGFEPDYLARAPTPNIDALATRGNLAVARGSYRTISNPLRATMSTGAYPEVHGNVAYAYDPATNTAHGQTRLLEAETIAERLAAEGMNVASVQWYMVQNHGTTYGDPEHLYVQPGGPFATRADAAIEILHRRPVNSGGTMVTVPRIPELLAVYGSDLDGLGHGEGAESPRIPAMLTALDGQLGRIVQATRDVGIHDETAFILTSDHGMTTWTRTLIPQVLAAIEAAGHSPQIVTPGNSPAATTDVIIVPSAVRSGAITLRGDAATPAGHRAVRRALRSLPEIARVLDRDDLRRLHASQKEGDLIAEATPPWGFALSVPADGSPRGSHGSLLEMRVPLLLAGAGVRPGRPLHRPGLVDVAPTIADLLGVSPPADAQGRSLIRPPGQGGDDDDGHGGGRDDG